MLKISANRVVCDQIFARKGYPHSMMILAYFRMKFSSLKMNSDRLANRLDESFSAAAIRPCATAAATRASCAAVTVFRWTPGPVSWTPCPALWTPCAVLWTRDPVP